MNEQATLSNSSDEEVTIPRRSKDRKRPSRISSDDDQELEHARPPVDNVDNGLDQKNQSSPLEEAVTRCSKDSARKRTVMIPSEDDDDDEDLEDAGAENATPSVALGQHDERRKRSCEKFRRQLMLDEYKVQREESRAKKKRRLSGHESDMNDQRHSSRHESMDEKVFPSTQSGAEDEPESEAQSPIPISSDSKEDSSTPNSKDGSSQDEAQSPIPISSNSEEDSSTPNSKDGSSQDEEDSSSPNSKDGSSQDPDEDSQENASISAEDLQFPRNPKRGQKEAFQIFLLSLLTEVLLGKYPWYGCLERIINENPHLADAKRKVDGDLEIRKTLVSSSRWDRKFTDELDKNSVLTNEKLPDVFKGKCQACRFSRGITRMISLQNDNGETVAEFRVGRFCAGKATIYHKIHHFCDVKLKKSCMGKIPDLKEVAAADRDRPVIESVIEYCKREEQRQWMNQLFDDYGKLLNEAENWTIEGRDYKDMQSTVFSDRT